MNKALKIFVIFAISIIIIMSKNICNATNVVETNDINILENTNLRTLTVTSGNLVPAFSPEINSYTLNISKDINEVGVEAIPENDECMVNIKGNTNIAYGESNITIDVITYSGKIKTYNIKVYREKQKLRLTSLKVENLSISPEFNSEIFEYSISLKANDVRTINIDAISNREDGYVSISGNENLQIGVNLIKLEVKSNETDESVTYTIKVNKIDDSKWKDNAFILSLAFLILIVVLIFVRLYKS